MQQAVLVEIAEENHCLHCATHGYVMSLRKEAAILIDVCKVDANVGLHAGCGDLQHPGGWVQTLC